MHLWSGPQDVRHNGFRIPQVGASIRPSSMQPGSLDDTASQLQYECLSMRRPCKLYIINGLGPSPSPMARILCLSRPCLSFFSSLLHHLARLGKDGLD